MIRALLFIIAFGWLCQLLQSAPRLTMKRTADIDREKRMLAYKAHLEREYRKVD